MSALISDCGRYRYILTRPSEVASPEKSTAAFVMLNPSTADATLDDRTIRRCRGFAKTWGCNGIAIANLYALRATNPEALWLAPDPVGPLNDQKLRAFALEHGEVVCAWGANADKARVAAVVAMFKRLNIRLWCLGTNKDGSPKHPLYLRGDQKPVPWEMPT